MDNQVEEVKQKTNIVNLVGGYVTLKKMGRNHKGLCPFHGEKTPSFMVNEELQIYKCFGCQAGGDAIKFLMEVEGLEFPDALAKLAEKVGVKLKRIENRGGDEKRELLAVHNLAAEYYHYLLTKHPEGEAARKYLSERGIGERLVETFHLGFALPEWDGLTKYLVNKKGYGQEVLAAAGLAIRSGNRVYDRFRGRVMFPLLDTAGKVVGFSGRVLPELAKDNEGKYINSPETDIYHKSKMLYGLTIARSEIKKKNRVVIVEGELDMISSFSAGISETVAIKGSAVTPEMIEILARLCSNFYFALDADAAGEAAMKRSIEAAENRGLSIKMVEIVWGKDPDEIARKNPNVWREAVEKAVPVYEFFFNKAIKRHGTETAEAVGAVVNEVVPYLAKVENSVVREVWVRKLSERIGVDRERVWEELEKERAGIRGRQKMISSIEGTPPTAGAVMAGRGFLAALMTASAEVISKIKKLFIGLPVTGAEGKLMLLIFEEGEIKKVPEFVGKLPGELTELAQEVCLLQPEEELPEKDLVKLSVDWARRVIKSERTALASQLRLAEERGEADQLDSLGEKLVKLNALENKLVLS